MLAVTERNTVMIKKGLKLITIRDIPDHLCVGGGRGVVAVVGCPILEMT